MSLVEWWAMHLAVPTVQMWVACWVQHSAVHSAMQKAVYWAAL